MPEDKDFKRIVRARMADTGERYTAARAGLRPDDASGEAADEPRRLAGVVPMDLAGLEAWRRDCPRPVPGEQPTSFGPRLGAERGGRRPRSTSSTRRGSRWPPWLSLGRVLGGVAYVSFGLHMLLPAPEGSDPDDPGTAPMPTDPGLLRPLSAAHAELQAYLGEYPRGQAPVGSSGLATGRLRRHEGGVVVPGRSEATVLLGEAGVGGRRGFMLDPSGVAAATRRQAARPWVAYGVVLHFEREFPTRQLPTDPPRRLHRPLPPGCPASTRPSGMALGAVFRARLPRSVGLPRWPLHQGKVHDPASRTGMGEELAATGVGGVSYRPRMGGRGGGEPKRTSPISRPAPSKAMASHSLPFREAEEWRRSSPRSRCRRRQGGERLWWRRRVRSSDLERHPLRTGPLEELPADATAGAAADRLVRADVVTAAGAGARAVARAEDTDPDRSGGQSAPNGRRHRHPRRQRPPAGYSGARVSG